MAVEWFRSWHGAPTDSKWLVVARRAGVEPGVVSAVFWALLDHASQHEDRGSVTGFDIETYSAWSGFVEEHVAAVIRELEGKEIIVSGRLAEWEKRQPSRERDAEANAARMREARAKKRHDAPQTTSVRQRAPSAEKVPPAPTAVRLGSPPDKDTDTDTEKKEESSATGVAALAPLDGEMPFNKRVQIEFDTVFWPAFPLKKDRKDAFAAFARARLKASLETIMAGLRAYIADKPADRSYCYAATFLNKERWNDEPTDAAARPTDSREPNHNASLRALAALARGADGDGGRGEAPGAWGGGDAGGPGGNGVGHRGDDGAPEARPEA